MGHRGGCFEHPAPVYPVSGVSLQPLGRPRPTAFLSFPLTPDPTRGPRHASPPHPRSPQLPPPRRSPGRPAQGCGHVASWRGSGRRRNRESSGRSSRIRGGSGRSPLEDQRDSRRHWRPPIRAKTPAHAPTRGAGRGAVKGLVRMCGRGCCGLGSFILLILSFIIFTRHTSAWG